MRSRFPGPPGSVVGRYLGAAIAATVALLGVAHAQGGAGRLNAQSPGLAWGPATVRPTVIFNYGYTDNIFYASSDLSLETPLASREGQIQPGIRFDLPFGESYLQGGYSALYRNYSTDDYTPTSQWSHYFDLDGHLRAGARGYFNLRDRFVRGSQELREVDPGGELTFGDLPFRSHTPSVEAGVDFGLRQGMSILWNYSSSQYSDIEGLGFSNFRGHGFQARYNYKIRPEASGYLYYGTDTMVQTRDEGDLNYDGTGVGLGYTQRVGRAITTQVAAGYQVLEATGVVDSSYHGPTATGSASWAVGDTTRLNLGVRRQPFQSFFLNNAYYLNRGVSLELMHQVSLSGYWRVMVGLDQNAYSDELDVTGFESLYCADDGNGGLVCPSAGVRRRDRGWHTELGFGAQLSRVSRWYLGYNRDSRTSNLLAADADGFGDPFAYDTNRYFFRIEVGWL
ncbi:MAG TPA: outer membrane beta-barrel protein [Candidatus Polarisedimenticolia bacterium]|nr:outer membrane beta-barrel protein [Candidatus Polarisedimenticolia bacterium]